MIFVSVSCITSAANLAQSNSTGVQEKQVAVQEQPKVQTVPSIVTPQNAKKPVVEVASNAKKGGFFDAVTSKKNEYKHLSPTKQTWSKCTKKDSDLFIVPFPYEQYMCYRYCDRVARVGGQCEKWVIKRYHFVSDHQIMVDRGPWIVQ